MKAANRARGILQNGLTIGTKGAKANIMNEEGITTAMGALDWEYSEARRIHTLRHTDILSHIIKALIIQAQLILTTWVTMMDSQQDKATESMGIRIIQDRSKEAGARTILKDL
jgi:hypothetical protein